MSKPADSFPTLPAADPVKDLMIDARLDVFVETLYALSPDILAINIQIIREATPTIKTHVEICQVPLLGSAAVFDWLQIALHDTLRGEHWKLRERRPEGRKRVAKRGH